MDDVVGRMQTLRAELQPRGAETDEQESAETGQENGFRLPAWVAWLRLHRRLDLGHTRRILQRQFDRLDFDRKLVETVCLPSSSFASCSISADDLP